MDESYNVYYSKRSTIIWRRCDSIYWNGTVATTARNKVTIVVPASGITIKNTYIYVIEKLLEIYMKINNFLLQF